MQVKIEITIKSKIYLSTRLIKSRIKRKKKHISICFQSIIFFKASFSNHSFLSKLVFNTCFNQCLMFISVTLYKCEVDRPDCSRCLSNSTTRPELMCGWCRSDTMCTVSDSCSGGWITSNDNVNCPAPVLKRV